MVQRATTASTATRAAARPASKAYAARLTSTSAHRSRAPTARAASTTSTASRARARPRLRACTAIWTSTNAPLTTAAAQRRRCARTTTAATAARPASSPPHSTRPARKSQRLETAQWRWCSTAQCPANCCSLQCQRRACNSAITASRGAKALSKCTRAIEQLSIPPAPWYEPHSPRPR
jgi:hypothetical protein